jgi:hypothetical protein
MAIELDQTSRATIHRFLVKCVVAIAISLFARPNYLMSAARCFQLYALLMGLIAVLTRQRYSGQSFNHWSEALWLAFISAGLQVYSHAAV